MSPSPSEITLRGNLGIQRELSAFGLSLLDADSLLIQFLSGGYLYDDHDGFMGVFLAFKY